MDQFPFGYERIAGTTWAYLSSLLMLALFFKFNRFWSVRNFDLFLIILLAPGLLMVEGGRRWLVDHHPQQSVATAGVENGDIVQNGIQDTDPESTRNGNGSDTDVPAGVPTAAEQNLNKDSNSDLESSAESPDEAEKSESQKSQAGNGLETKPVLNTPGHDWQRWGYYWLFSVGAVFLIRMLIDPGLARRPLLEPNLSIGGLVFFACSLMIFLFANIVTSEPMPDDLRGARNAVKMIQREAAKDVDTQQLRRRGPGYTLFNLFPIIPSFESGNEILETDADQSANMSRYVIAAKSLAIASQILIVLGLVFFCYYHFHNFYIGIGTATIYLMLPYTAIYTGHVLHTLPAALILWAMVSFRRPWLAGILFGLATGVAYYPIFLLPLWASFYWERGVGQFVWGVLISICICIGGLTFTSVDTLDFFHQLQSMFGFWLPLIDGLEGIWALGWNQWWRLPLLVAFVLFCVSFAAWPNEKNIGTLVSYSAAVMLAVQFWHGFGGGLYVAWYLPMVLLIIFRPNLSGRVATAELQGTQKPHKETAEDLLPAA